MLLLTWLLLFAVPAQVSGPGQPLTSNRSGQATLGGVVSAQPAAPPSSPSEPAPMGPQQTPSDDGSTILEGRVLIGPTCPVARPGGCQDRPYAGTISIQTPDGSQEITQVSADDQGNFEVALDPGTYLVVPLSPEGSRLPYAPPQEVTLDPGTRTSIAIQYDSGIR